MYFLLCFFCQKRIEDELQSSRVSDVSTDTPQVLQAHQMDS